VALLNEQLILNLKARKFVLDPFLN